MGAMAVLHVTKCLLQPTLILWILGSLQEFKNLLPSFPCLSPVCLDAIEQELLRKNKQVPPPVCFVVFSSKQMFCFWEGGDQLRLNKHHSFPTTSVPCCRRAKYTPGKSVDCDNSGIFSNLSHSLVPVCRRAKTPGNNVWSKKMVLPLPCVVFVVSSKKGFVFEKGVAKLPLNKHALDLTPIVDINGRNLRGKVGWYLSWKSRMLSLEKTTKANDSLILSFLFAMVSPSQLLFHLKRKDVFLRSDGMGKLRLNKNHSMYSNRALGNLTNMIITSLPPITAPNGNNVVPVCRPRRKGKECGPDPPWYYHPCLFLKQKGFCEKWWNGQVTDLGSFSNSATKHMVGPNSTPHCWYGKSLRGKRKRKHAMDDTFLGRVGCSPWWTLCTWPRLVAVSFIELNPIQTLPPFPPQTPHFPHNPPTRKKSKKFLKLDWWTFSESNERWVCVLSLE